MKYVSTLKDEIFICEICGEEYKPKSRNSKYCQECRNANKHSQYTRTWPTVKKKGGFIGALSELSVCIDLLSKNFEVYRNISAHGSVDIIAYDKGGQLITIEVTTGLVNEFTKTRYLSKHRKHINRIDILAVCYFDGIKYYETDGKNWEVEVDIEKWSKSKI